MIGPVLSENLQYIGYLLSLLLMKIKNILLFKVIVMSLSLLFLLHLLQSKSSSIVIQSQLITLELEPTDFTILQHVGSGGMLGYTHIEEEKGNDREHQKYINQRKE